MVRPLTLEDLYIYGKVDDFTDHRLYANINGEIIPLRLFEVDPTTKQIILHENYRGR